MEMTISMTLIIFLFTVIQHQQLQITLIFLDIRTAGNSYVHWEKATEFFVVRARPTLIFGKSK